MKKKKCIYCDTIYPEDVEKCPLCGGASAEYITDPDEEAALKETAPTQREPESPAPEQKRERAPRPQAPKYSDDDDDDDEESGGPIPRWMTILICAVLAAALIVGIAFAGYSLGIFGGGGTDEPNTGGSLDMPFEDGEEQQDNQNNDQQPENGDEQEQPSTTNPDEGNTPSTGDGETTTPPETDDEEEDENPPVDTQPDVIACTGITLNKSDVTLMNRGETFTLNVTLSPSNTTEKLTFKSTDESYATVDENGKVTAVNGSGSSNVVARIIATCGSESAECLIRCNFANSEDGSTAEGGGSFSLSITDFTMSYVNEEVMVSVENANLASDTFSWSIDDSSVASITPAEDAVIVTALKTGTTTLRVTINGSTELTCIVRCSAAVGGAGTETGGTTETGETSAETGGAEGGAETGDAES